jgi:hypothetical protein
VYSYNYFSVSNEQGLVFNMLGEYICDNPYPSANFDIQICNWPLDMHMYTLIYKYTQEYTSSHVYSALDMCLWTWIHVFTLGYKNADRNIHIHTCIHPVICICALRYTYTHRNIYIHICVHSWICIWTTPIYVCTPGYTYLHFIIQTHIGIYIFTYVFALGNAYVHLVISWCI